MDFQTPAQSELFTHERLKLGGNSLRLITLYPDQNEYNFIYCDINQYALHRRPGYIALSYMWGSADEQYHIYLNGRPFYVRRNLYDCLVQLRKQHYEPLTLWIDALCIDQDNIPERNHIVQLMDQVYERADQVYVWLGSGDESSEKAMRFLREIAASMENQKDAVDAFLEMYMLPAIHHQHWVDVVRLLKRDYWSRLWIVQELLLAPSLELFCGGHRIMWKDVQQVILLAQHSFNHYDKRRAGRTELHTGILKTLAARMVLRRCDSTQFQGRRDAYPSLQTLLETFKESQCFDSRDKIFGLMSIAGDFYDKRVEYIDYNLRPTQVFIKFLQLYLKSSSSHEDEKTLYYIRRLSDALKINVFSEILRRRDYNADAALAYQDLSINSDDSVLTMPCRVLLDFVQKEETMDSLVPSCVLRDYFGSTASADLTPLRPFVKPYATSTPASPEELTKLRRLALSQASQICNAWTEPNINTNTSPSTFKYFTRPPDKYNTNSKPCFGLTCTASKPGDVLVKSAESDLAFVARHTGDGVYNVIGTALVHEDSSTRVRIKSSMRKWLHPSSSLSPSSSPTASHGHGHNRTISHARSRSPSPTSLPHPPSDPFSPMSASSTNSTTSSTSSTQNTVFSKERQIPQVRFNPLMLLMIVNMPEWRKDLITSPTTPTSAHHFHRGQTSYNAIEPQGDDDPVLKEYGIKHWTGSAHVDRAANKFRDRAVWRMEEIRERAGKVLEE